MDKMSNLNSTREEGELSDDEDVCEIETVAIPQLAKVAPVTGVVRNVRADVRLGASKTRSATNTTNTYSVGISFGKMKLDAPAVTLSNKQYSITAKTAVAPVSAGGTCIATLQDQDHQNKLGQYSNYRGFEIYPVNVVHPNSKNVPSFSDNMRDKLNFYGSKRGRSRTNSRDSGVAPGKSCLGYDGTQQVPIPLMSIDGLQPTSLNFSLIADPPPPPPPPPPPLPSSPPPSSPPPPLPLASLSRKGKRGARSNHGRGRFAQPSRCRPASPIGDVEDTDYIDLLLEYKQIQQQLQSIRKQEQKVARLSGEFEPLVVTLSGQTSGKAEVTDKGQPNKRPPKKNLSKKDLSEKASSKGAPNKGVPDKSVLGKATSNKDLPDKVLPKAVPLSSGKADEPIEISDSDDAEDDKKKDHDAVLNKINDDVETTHTEQEAPATNTAAQQVPMTAEEEEELEIMELRRAALASAANKATAKSKVPDDPPATNTRSAIQRRRSSDRSAPLRKHVRRRSSRRPLEVHERTSDRVRDSGPSTAMMRHEELRREHKAILALDDPREQYRRFLCLTVVPPAGRDRYEKTQISAKELAASALDVDMRVTVLAVHDNYEPVEMDIDSNSESPISTSMPMDLPDPVDIPSGISHTQRSREHDYNAPTRVSCDMATPMVVTVQPEPYNIGDNVLADQQLEPTVTASATQAADLATFDAYASAVTTVPPQTSTSLSSQQQQPVVEPIVIAPEVSMECAHPNAAVADRAQLSVTMATYHVQSSATATDHVQSSAMAAVDCVQSSGMAADRVRLCATATDCVQSSVTAANRVQSSAIEDDDDAEEAMLRAQLLIAMAAKRREKELAASKSKEEEEEEKKKTIPVVNKTMMSSKTNNSASKHKVKIPIHQRVIISLGKDSSDSDQDGGGDGDEPVAPSASRKVSPPQQPVSDPTAFTNSLDLFLKEARQSAEAISKQRSSNTNTPTPPPQPTPSTPASNSSLITTTPTSTVMASSAVVDSSNPVTLQTTQSIESRRKEQVAKVRAIAEKIKQERQLIFRHDNAMLSMQRQLRQRRLSHRSAEQKAAKLREQLAAAERIVHAHAQPILKITNRITLLGGQLKSKRVRVSRLVQSLNFLEEKIFGKVMNLSEASPQKSSAETVPTTPPRSRKRGPLSPAEELLASEKQRLLRRERCYADIIRRFKQQQGLADGGSDRGSDQGSDQRTVQLSDRDSELMTGQLRNDAGEFNDNDGQDGDDQENDHITDHQANHPMNEPTTPPMAHIVTEERMTFSEPCEHDTPLSSIAKPSSLIDLTQANMPNLPPEETTTEEAHQSPVKREFVAPNEKQLRKLRRLHKENTSQPPLLNSLPTTETSLFEAHISPIPEAKASNLINTSSTSESQPNNTSRELKAYRSALLRFRSYRLNPYYRLKEKMSISSATCTHRIRPNVPLCQFDLMGKCNDDKCARQHIADILMSDALMLSDLVSYNPAVAGVTDDMAVCNYDKHIGDYIENWMKLSHKMSHEEQCVLLAARVNEKAKHVPPHVMIMEKRRWCPQQKERELTVDDCVPPPTASSSEVTVSSQQRQPKKTDTRWGFGRDEDNLVGDTDVRYWISSDVSDMESAVLASPNDIQLWLKLTSRKLHSLTGTSEQNLELALNVLSRALEHNRDSSTLWLSYLRLYRRRTDCTADLGRLYKQALHYAPIYAIYWKCIESADTVTAGSRLCVRLRKWLISQPPEDASVFSHRLLEVFLYRVFLYIHTGRYVDGVALMKAALTAKRSENYVSIHLTLSDRVVGWLTYIHLMEFHQLPPALFDDSDNSRGRIVAKDAWVYPWRVGEGTKMSATMLHSLLNRAQTECESRDASDHVTLPIHVNILQLHVARKRWDLARSTCHGYITAHNRSVPSYMQLVKLELRQGSHKSAIQVLSDALLHNACSAELYHVMASVCMLKGNVDTALETLEKCAISFFQIEDTKLCDPNQLYCVLLSQPCDANGTSVSMSFDRMPLVTADHVKSQQLYLWLNYSLLLELQGEKAMDVYETAICSLGGQTQHVATLWNSYLRYLYRTTLAASATQQDIRLRDLSSATRRCLVTTPSRESIPNDTRNRVRYDRHTGIVELYVSMLPVCERMRAYETLTAMMPVNVTLQLRACEHAINIGDLSMARGICLTALRDHPKNLQLWRMNLFLAHKQSSYAEIRQIFEDATSQLPYMLTLWKDFMLFEMAHGNAKGMKRIGAHCRQFSLNMDDFVTALMK